MTIKPLLAVGAAAALLGSFTSSNAQAPAPVDFEKEILPLFKNSCFKCHQKEQTDASGKVKKPKGKFRMDSAAMLLKGGEEGSDLVPGDAAKSLIYTLSCLPASDDKVMPPDGKADPLTAAQQELLKRWINEGAKFGAWTGAAD
jgi:Planctomycete cytochrome C